MTVSLNRSRSSQGHNLCIHCSTVVHDATCHVLLKLVHQFRRFMKVFTIYGHGGHLGHVTWIIYVILWFPLPIDASYQNLALIGQAVSFNIMVIYMYIAPGWGQTSP